MSTIGEPAVSIAAASPYAREREIAIAAVIEAGLVVRRYYDRADTATYTKDDGSAVTDADLASDQVLRAILTQHFPDDPILTEEGLDESDRLSSSRCWIADPIDGTEQFIRRTGDFDVLLALAVDGRPAVVAGFNPPTGLLCAAEIGQGAWVRDDAEPTLRRLHLTPVAETAAPQLATSVWFGAPLNRALVERIGRRFNSDAIEPVATGFSPRVFLAAQSPDAYLGIKPGDEQTMGWEWDFATADLFIREAGGLVSNLAGDPYRYNKPVPRSRNGLLAARDPRTHGRLLTAVLAERAPDGSFPP